MALSHLGGARESRRTRNSREERYRSKKSSRMVIEERRSQGKFFECSFGLKGNQTVARIFTGGRGLNGHEDSVRGKEKRGG